MAKIDKVKEQVGYLKVIFGLLFATDLSMVAFLFNHYGMLSAIRIVLVFLGVIAITLSIYFVNKEILAKIDEMEDL